MNKLNDNQDNEVSEKRQSHDNDNNEDNEVQGIRKLVLGEVSKKRQNTKEVKEVPKKGLLRKESVDSRNKISDEVNKKGSSWIDFKKIKDRKPQRSQANMSIKDMILKMQEENIRKTEEGRISTPRDREGLKKLKEDKTDEVSNNGRILTPRNREKSKAERVNQRKKQENKPKSIRDMIMSLETSKEDKQE